MGVIYVALSDELISKFVKTVTINDSNNTKKEETIYGTTVKYDEKLYVQLDGSDLLTPVSSTTDVKAGERVIVLIKNHAAIVTGNLTSPSARTDDVKELGTKISDFEIVIADKVSTIEFDAEKGRIDNLIADNAVIQEELSAAEANISELLVDNETIKGKLNANEANITKLQAEKIDVVSADAKYATIENLNATNANLDNLEATHGEFVDVTTEKLTAIDTTIENLNTKYANIDFSNISKATMEIFYANSGLIKNVSIGDATISGELVGVTIKGDLIEGGTVVADKLVIKGDNGLYYKLNTDGIKTETEQTEYNSLNGEVITAKSITATKIDVHDLVAFDATIGGFKITDNSIYSGVKESIDNTTRGIYMDKDGQIVFGDSNNFVKFYKDSDGKYKLSISAENIIFGVSGKNVEDEISSVNSKVENLKDEITTNLRIESSRGTVFKNNTVATVLSVVIYHGSQRITDSATMKSIFGNDAYLQWKWQRIDDDSFGVISSSDTRFGDNGFTFTLSSNDVDTKTTFMCELIT